MVSGDVILLPITVQKLVTETKDCSTDETEVNFIRSLVLYKVFVVSLVFFVPFFLDLYFQIQSFYEIQDPAIIVINKPPGMPVQVIPLDILFLGIFFMKYLFDYYYCI